MKFRDGMWLTAEGLRVEYAEEVYNIKKTNQKLSLLCPTKKIRSRGDTLNLSTLTIVRKPRFRLTGHGNHPMSMAVSYTDTIYRILKPRATASFLLKQPTGREKSTKALTLTFSPMASPRSTQKSRIALRELP